MLAPAFRGGLRAGTSGYAAYRGARTVRRSLSGQTPPAARRTELGLPGTERASERGARPSGRLHAGTGGPGLLQGSRSCADETGGHGGCLQAPGPPASIFGNKFHSRFLGTGQKVPGSGGDRVIKDPLSLLPRRSGDPPRPWQVGNEGNAAQNIAVTVDGARRVLEISGGHYVKLSNHGAVHPKPTQNKTERKEKCPIHTSTGQSEGGGQLTHKDTRPLPRRPRCAPAPRTDGWTPSPARVYFWKLVPRNQVPQPGRPKGLAPRQPLTLSLKSVGLVGCVDARVRPGGTAVTWAAEPVPLPALP
ncbi:PREDICTED: uncharacterized protein LOC107529582 [Miniopterus natalensis]|uniref:uncharacterized protein LOC107529582 n=1 Tax=Miniopterus natalensis TaxID=291302 RepID=UPI0007A6B48D|nr:PREDICTED: uncharacterized protein LOC107529582 [Miniopterus natalensis]